MTAPVAASAGPAGVVPAAVERPPQQHWRPRACVAGARWRDPAVFEAAPVPNMEIITDSVSEQGY